MNKNFKWPISSSINIDASVSDIWDAITSPGNLNDCHPFCKKNTVVDWSEDNSKDIILYYNGRELERNFFEWEKDPTQTKSAVMRHTSRMTNNIQTGTSICHEIEYILED